MILLHRKSLAENLAIILKAENPVITSHNLHGTCYKLVHLQVILDSVTTHSLESYDGFSGIDTASLHNRSRNVGFVAELWGAIEFTPYCR